MSTYSHSRLMTFKNCPLQFKFRYIDKIETEVEFETIEAFMGKRVHETLKKLYQDLKMCKKVTLEELLDFFDDQWEKNWTESVQIIKKDYTAKNYRDLGKKCIMNYWKRHYPFNEGKTLWVEEPVLFDIGDGHQILGYIDRLAENGDGIYEIHDYKTSGFLPTQEQKDNDAQLALYQIGLEKKFPDIKKVKLIWHYLVFDKIFFSEKTKQEIEDLKKDIIETIQEIERRKESGEFPYNESGLCDWCEFQEMCPAKKHLVNTQEMEPNQYFNEPGVKLANKYIELRDKKKSFIEEIDKEISKIEEALVQYAKEQNVEVIRGNDKKIRIRLFCTSKFPNKNEEKRKELDELIKKSGKWLEVSDLNTSMLNKIIENPLQFNWDKKLIEKIKEYQTIEEAYRFYISNLDEREKFDGD